MALPQSIDVALKEWATVCNALGRGEQILLLRKGGIEDYNGEFTVQHRQFLLFPTYLHQNLTMLKPPAQEGFEAYSAEPAEVRLGVFGEVTDILRVASRAQMDALDEEHVWTAPLIDMRFNYRKDNPLYLLLVRAYRLEEPLTVANTPAYAGCKSWVPLGTRVPVLASAVLGNDAYADKRERIVAHF